MRTIWKYELDVTDQVALQMPAGATILPFANAPSLDEIHIWAEVDTDQPKTPRKIVVVGTGNPIDWDLQPRMSYLASVVADPFVWHIYELDTGTHVDGGGRCMFCGSPVEGEHCPWCDPSSHTPKENN